MVDDTPSKDQLEREESIQFGRRVDWTIAAIILIIAILFIYMLQSLPERATFFPWFITISIMIVSGIYMYGKIKKPEIWDDLYDPEAELDLAENDIGPPFIVAYKKQIARTLLIFSTLIFVTFLIGPKYSVPIFVTAMLWMSKENKIVAILSGIFFWIVIEFIFGNIMSINLPVGYIFDWIS